MSGGLRHCALASRHTQAKDKTRLTRWRSCPADNFGCLARSRPCRVQGVCQNHWLVGWVCSVRLPAPLGGEFAHVVQKIGDDGVASEKSFVEALPYLDAILPSSAGGR